MSLLPMKLSQLNHMIIMKIQISMICAHRFVHVIAAIRTSHGIMNTPLKTSFLLLAFLLINHFLFYPEFHFLSGIRHPFMYQSQQPKASKFIHKKD